MEVERLIQVPQITAVMKNDKKVPFYPMINLLMKNLCKNTTNIDFGRETWLNFNWKIIFSSVWGFLLKWPFNTIGRQYKQTTTA